MTKTESRKKRQLEGTGESERNAGSDTEMVDETIDVTFEFCDLKPIDYHALKHLISQLFRIDSTVDEDENEKIQEKRAKEHLKPSKAPLKVVPQDIDLGELADIILGDQKEWVGITVKCDDEDESDPYGFVSVLDLKAYQNKSSVSKLTSYLLSCINESNSSQSSDLSKILNQSIKADGEGVGLLLSERLINMPVQIMPQLLMQVGNEIKHAQSKKAPGFGFDKILIPSRVFSIPKASEDELNPTFDHNKNGSNNVNKKLKPNDEKDDGDLIMNDESNHEKNSSNNNDNDDDEFGLYHPEDQIISKFSSHTIHFDFSKPKSSSIPKNSNGSKEDKNEDNLTKNMRGFDQRGRLMLIELSKWDSMAQSLMQFIGSQS